LERSLGTRDFWRVRVGVGRPDRKSEVASWVMGPLGRDEVRACEWEDGKGGELVEKVWEEILRIGYAPEEDED
jgi:PTH1 family peptidyl-tRNA hydrolase